MKRFMMLLGALCVILTVTPAISAFAADSGGGVKPASDDRPPSNITITVVMPEAAVDLPGETAPPAPEPITMYPVDVTETVEGGVRTIIKTYELNADENPADIPRGDFERSAGTSGARWAYTLTDILRKESANMEIREHTEAVTISTDSKEIEAILPLLPQTMAFKSEDGFVGVLTLDVASIKVESAGTRTTSYTMNVTREYPHLSANDSSLVPKTVDDNGKTYTLAGVEWKIQRVEVVDYEDVPTSYTAVATYSATGSSTRVTGYNTTAEYKGTLSKLVQGKTVYIAYFVGEEIRTSLEMTEPPTSAPTEAHTEEAPTETSEAPDPTETLSPTDAPDTTDAPGDSALEPSDKDGIGGGRNNAIVLYIAIPAGIAVIGSLYYISKKRKGKSNHA